MPADKPEGNQIAFRQSRNASHGNSRPQFICFLITVGNLPLWPGLERSVEKSQGARIVSEKTTTHPEPRLLVPTTPLHVSSSRRFLSRKLLPCISLRASFQEIFNASPPICQAPRFSVPRHHGHGTVFTRNSSVVRGAYGGKLRKFRGPGQPNSDLSFVSVFFLSRPVGSLYFFWPRGQ